MRLLPNFGNAPAMAADAQRMPVPASLVAPLGDMAAVLNALWVPVARPCAGFAPTLGR